MPIRLLLICLAFSAALLPGAAARAQNWERIGSSWGTIGDVSTGASGTWAACEAGLLRLDGDTWTLAAPDDRFEATPTAVLALGDGTVLVALRSGVLLRWTASGGFAELARLEGHTIRELASSDGRRVFVASSSEGIGTLRELVGTELRPVRGVSGDFRVLAASGPRDALLVGAALARFDGRAFRTLAAPPVTLTSVAFEAPRRAWAVGPGGGLFSWNGRVLEELALPEAIEDASAVAVAAPGEVVIAASSGIWRGASTSLRRIGPAAGVAGLARIGDRVLAYGGGGLLGWVGDSGVVPSSPVGPLGAVMAISGASDHRILAADARALSRWDGREWSRELLPEPCEPLGIASTADRTIVLCAGRGAVFRDESGWAREDLDTAGTPLVLSHRGEVWALGTIARHRDTSGRWSDVPLPAGFDAVHGGASEERMVVVDRSRRRLLELRAGAFVPLEGGGSADDLAVTGATLVTVGDAVRVHDASGWRELPGYPRNGYAPDSVAATSAVDLWVVQYGGALVHWDGRQWARVATPFRPQRVVALGRDVVLIGPDARLARLRRLARP